MFSEERVITICESAKLKLAELGINIINEVDYKAKSNKYDDLIRYWNILSAIEYRKDFDNADIKFQRLVFLLHSKLNITKREFAESNYIDITIIEI